MPEGVLFKRAKRTKPALTEKTEDGKWHFEGKKKGGRTRKEPAKHDRRHLQRRPGGGSSVKDKNRGIVCPGHKKLL